jgi:hypothetical protein
MTEQKQRRMTKRAEAEKNDRKKKQRRITERQKKQNDGKR